MIRKRANILGVAVDVVSFQEAVNRIEELVSIGKSHYVCVASTQDIMIAQKEQRFRQIVNHADLATPDGWPVVWAIRVSGYEQRGRVTGPDLMLAMCERSIITNHSHFFYGGAEGVPELLAQKLKEQFPGLKVKGVYSPPFRPLAEEEDKKVVEMLNNSGADMLWVGLGTPKQHFWIKDHLGKVKIPVMLGVGAAFDFHSGRIKRAPKWMQNNGLEWLHRLYQEPRRLWLRYFEYLPKFALKFTAQFLQVRHYSADDK